MDEQLELSESAEEQQIQEDKLNSDTKDDDMKNEIKQELEADEKRSKNSKSPVIDEPELKPERTEKHELMDEEKEESSEEDGDEEDDEPVIEYLDTAPLYRDPTFAEIASFFNTFAHLLGIQPLSIEKFSKLLTTLIDGQVCKDLIDLHVTLLRKIYLKSTRADKWEKALLKFCSLTSGLETETRQLQRQNYVKIPLSSKLNIMKALCDSQFDWNLKFKENIANTFRCNELRMSPIGSDKTGQLYYFQLDCDLAYRVYTEEPDDMAGASWTLKASNEMELTELLETLKSPEFGKKTKEEEEEEQADAEIDEEQILDQPKEEEKRKEFRPSSAGSGGSKSEIVKKIQMSEEERKKIRMEDKNVVYWDRYKRQEILNKRKLERENRKKERLTGGPMTLKIAPTEIAQNEPENREEKNKETENNEKDEQVKEMEEKNVANEEQKEEKNEMVEKEELNPVNGEKEEEEKATPAELDEALLAELEAEDRRRILPRRNARNTAIQNIKVFTITPRRRNDDSSEAASSNLPIQKLGFVATAGSASEDESEEEESDEEEDEGRTSDDEFYLDEDERPKVRKLGRPPTKRTKMKVGKTKKGGKIKGKGKKKDSHGRQIVRPSAIKMVTSRKQQTVTFVDEESSGGEEEETDDEAKREEKERRRATALSLCQRCRQGTQPDLLLLCDSCDDAWHTDCLRPQLWFVPDGDWFCPLCEHSSLIQRLTFVLVTVREERKVREQNEKKKAAEDRLKREMDFIGSQLNDIMARKNEEPRENSSEEDDDEEEDEGGEPQRKSKKRAMKIVMSRTRQQRKMEKKFFAAPVMTIAEGRSRRALNKVDYNFRSYDEQLQEAMGIDSDGKGEEEVEESCGAGRGKDMQNIVGLKRKREEETNRNEDGEEEEQGQRGRMAERNENAPARPPKGPGTKKAIRKQHKRLTDLDCDNATESDTDEWQQGSDDEFEEDPEPSEDEYLPSERRRNGIRGQWARHRSDDEFINDDSDPDYMEESKGRKRKGGGKKGRGGWFTGRKTKGRQRGKKKKDESSSEEDAGEEMPSGSDSDQAGPSKRRKIANGPAKKWNPKANSSDSEEENEEEEEEESEVEMTETGRPLRRSAANSKTKLKEMEKAEEEEDEEEEEEMEKEDEFMEEKSIKDEDDNDKIQPKSGENIERLADRAASALAKPTIMAAAKGEEEVDEFEPDSEEEEAIDDEEEELEKELADLPNEDEEDEEEEGNKKEDRSSSSSESDNESGNEERIIPTTIEKRKALTSSKTAPPAKKKAPPPKRGRKKVAAAKKPAKKVATRKKSTGKKSKSSDEDDEKEDEIKEEKSQKQQKKTAPIPPKQPPISADEPKASTSTTELQSTQRQTRQQLRRQQSSTTTNTAQITTSTIVEKKKSPALMISTSMGMAATNESSSSTLPPPPATIQQPKIEQQLPPFTVEVSLSPKKLNAKPSAQSRSFESNKSPPPKTTEVTAAATQGNEVKKAVEIPVPKTSAKKQTSMATNIPSSSNQQQQMLKGIPAISNKPTNVTIAPTTTNALSGPNSADSSPGMKTIFQSVQPQQLSQYFLRPSANTPPPPPTPHPQHQPPPRHQQNTTTSAGTNVGGVPLQQQMAMTTIVHHHGPPRFTIQPAPPTTSYAYSISPAVGTMTNGNPTFVSVAPPPQHMATSGAGPVGLTHHPPPHLPPGAIPHHFPPHSQPTAYFVQQGPAGAPPQIIYQTLQPYATVMHHPSQSQGQPPQMLLQPGMAADPESLSHALAGAMNPEDL